MSGSDMNEKKIERLADLLEQYVNGTMTSDEAKQQADTDFRGITAEELALAEQRLAERGVPDQTVYDHIEAFLQIFADALVAPEFDLPEWHPIRTYLREDDAVQDLLRKVSGFSRERLIHNDWLDLLDQLESFKVHLARKQNQLYPALEKHGFDRPSKIMWTLDDAVADAISAAKTELQSGDIATFCQKFGNAEDKINDLVEKERAVLYPAALDILPDDELPAMRAGDDEIGYCLITPPPPAPKAATASLAQGNFVQELSELMARHGIGQPTKELDVRQGKLTLEQLNLIFQHLPVDLSFVDENELVRFYSDTKHRIFPRSPGAIGRDVKNCHPRESVHIVEEIIQAFRDGSQDEAEFWLEMGDKFIYILYTAVRDENGVFKGVLEMMQDATHIRGLQGSSRLLAWKQDEQDDKQETSAQDERAPVSESRGTEIGPDTLIGDLVKAHSGLRDYLPSISPKYKKLANPAIFKLMADSATLDMVAARGGLTADTLIDKIRDWIAQTDLKQAQHA